jgi:hypothetical protein
VFNTTTLTPCVVDDIIPRSINSFCVVDDIIPRSINSFCVVDDIIPRSINSFCVVDDIISRSINPSVQYGNLAMMPRTIWKILGTDTNRQTSGEYAALLDGGTESAELCRVALMVLCQFSDIWSANIRKLAKDHKSYGSAATDSPEVCRLPWLTTYKHYHKRLYAPWNVLV